jgi:hypothetical protein
MLKALALKLETAELNLETADLLRKKDMEKAESLRMKVEKAESLRKEDMEKAESLRKKVEKAESLRKEDAGRAELLRKKDAEKAESMRKKDTERMETLRKKDRAELEDKIKHLEQHSSEREDQWKQKYESTQRYIESLASDIDATTDFLAVGVCLFILFFSLPLMSFGFRTRLALIESSAATC